MDRRSWPWKRKSSDKTITDKGAAVLDSTGSQGDQDKHKKPTYVQISAESYSRLTGLEEQVKAYEKQEKQYQEQVSSLEEQVDAYEERAEKYKEQVSSLEDETKELKEKLSAAQTEITSKDDLVKQHAKVAEEAVSGWEKAEAEALALKNHLESVTLSKLTAEDRASHLDGALKECMRQIRNLKEEHEQKLQEVVLTKTKQWEKIKLDLEARIANLDHELLRSEAENSAISRSLQDRSNMLIKVSEEKARAEAEIELLKSNIESCEREINSLKYEVHVVSKELEIRNEEKNMSMKSAEAANKQHMEGVKKIAKLEAECQRLRGLVRKKLPGPAALAQMKLEVDSWGRDYGETRNKRSPVKPSSPQFSPVTEFSLDNVQKFQKENDLLTERLLAMEEETKMLKEALAKRNSELQASRNLCAKTASKLQSLELQMKLNNQQKSPPKLNSLSSADGTVIQNGSNPHSLASMSEDGNDDAVSCADSLAATSVSESSQIKKDKKTEKLNTNGSSVNLGLMDDFLEMEKFAGLSNDTNTVISLLGSSNRNVSGILCHGASGESLSEKQQASSIPEPTSGNQAASKVESQPDNSRNVNQPPYQSLRLRISSLLESVSNDTDMVDKLEDVKRVVQEAYDSLHQRSITCVSEEKHHSDAMCDGKSCPEDTGLSAEKEITLPQDSEPATKSVRRINEDLADAISKIHEFVLLLGKEATAVHQKPLGGCLSYKIEQFSATLNNILQSETNLDTFVRDLSYVLAEASELRFSVLGYRDTESLTSSPDCIDKVALPANKLVKKESAEEGFEHSCAHIPHPEVPDDGNVVRGYESNSISSKISLEDYEQLKSERDNMANEVAKYTESLQMTKSQLEETDQLLTEVKSQLTAAQRSNGLAETQLKCMAESYRSLERRAEELESELTLLRGKVQALENELQDEKTNHQDALARCKELEEQLQCKESCSVCVSSSAAEPDIESKQEREIAAAAEKLAECQETIFLLGKQLKALHPSADFIGSPHSERSQKGDVTEELPTTSPMTLQDFDQAETGTAGSDCNPKGGDESPMDLKNAFYCPSDAEAKELLKSPSNSKPPKHRRTKSGSSSSSIEKHSRGFGRFFSSKGKNSR